MHQCAVLASSFVLSYPVTSDKSIRLLFKKVFVFGLMLCSRLSDFEDKDMCVSRQAMEEWPPYSTSLQSTDCSLKVDSFCVVDELRIANEFVCLQLRYRLSIRCQIGKIEWEKSKVEEKGRVGAEWGDYFIALREAIWESYC